LLLLVVAGAGESFFLSEMLMVDEDVEFCELPWMEFWSSGQSYEQLRSVHVEM
jgi:hypothetical protein